MTTHEIVSVGGLGALAASIAGCFGWWMGRHPLLALVGVVVGPVFTLFVLLAGWAVVLLIDGLLRGADDPVGAAAGGIFLLSFGIVIYGAIPAVAGYVVGALGRMICLCHRRRRV